MAESETILTFTTKEDVTKSGILLKLTEPMYGIVALSDGKLDLSRTSGAFSLKSSNDKEIQLIANSNWYLYSEEVFQNVVDGTSASGGLVMYFTG